MARLIPSFMEDDTPPGERDVFNLLADGPDTWVAIHSLDLAPINRGLRTEIDFVVIVPDTGILCVEVKSHDSINYDGERWRPSTITRSPFKQAVDARYVFVRRLAEVAPQFRHVPVLHCCIFPRAQFSVHPNLSVQSWELMDSRSVGACDNGTEFCRALKANMAKGIQADGRLKALGHSLSANQVEVIVKACVPVQRRHPDARAEIARRETEIRRLLREPQNIVLQLSELNERLVVSGPAGTGKTLIALEVARRAAERGKRVALLCFNHLVGAWVKHQVEMFSPPTPNLIAGPAIRTLAEMANIEIPKNPSHEYWEKNLPELLEERLTDPDFGYDARFDYLVLDEAQDVLARPWLWECLSHFLLGGRESGSFCLFGDFDHQVLTERKQMEHSLEVLDSTKRPVRWKLSENCRNYRIVGDTAVKLAGLDASVYSGYLRTGGGLRNYNICFYETEQQQLEQLAVWLKEYKAEHYRPSEITLLSFRTDQASAAARLAENGYKLRPAWQSGDGMAYASVQAFKGMENKVIILTDVTLGANDFHRDLFYTGMTRSTESVRVLCDKRSMATLTGWLTGGLSHE